jgi:hypothetical protein
MVYKSKRINRKRYIKRQSRRKMYGGEKEVVPYESNKVYASNKEDKEDKEAYEIMKKIEEQNKIELPSITEIPIIGPVLEDTGNLVEGAAVKALDVIGNSIGVDIDNPQSISEKLDDVKVALTDPTNVEKAKEILGDAGKYGEVLIEAAAPVIEKTADKILPVVTKEADKAVKAGFGTVINLAEDVAGPFIGIPRTILSATEAFNASVNAGSELIKGTAEAVQGTQENMDRLLNTMQTVPSNKLSNVDLDKLSENDRRDYYRTDGFGQSGGSLKKYQKEATMIGGRIAKSQSDFLGGYVNRSQILKQYGGKWQTKRRNRFRRRMTSRRH